MNEAVKQLIIGAVAALKDEEVRAAIRSAEEDIDHALDRIGRIGTSVLAAIRDNKVKTLKAYIDLGLTPSEAALLETERARANTAVMTRMK